MLFFLGCFMRAQLYMDRITSYLRRTQPTKSWAEPHKHFVFGNLKIESGGGNGKASWWYHVALIVRLRDGKLYVLDPALSANPIKKQRWYNLMTKLPGSTITGYVTCNPSTYWPSNDCRNARRVDGDLLDGHTETYLNE